MGGIFRTGIMSVVFSTAKSEPGEKRASLAL